MKTPIINLIHAYFRRLGIRINALRIEEAYASHPLPHSIRSLSDTLDELQVENSVYALTFEQLFEIEGPFIVAVGREEYPFYLVEKLDKRGGILFLRTVANRSLRLTFEQFRAVWKGVTLMAEKGKNTQEDSRIVYWLKQGLWRVDRTAGFGIAALAAFFLITGILQVPAEGDWRYLIKSAGVLVSLLAVLKSSFDPRLAQRFCRHGQKADCNEVFHSAGAKLFGWISLGELSLAYFTASLLWGVFIAKDPSPVFIVLDVLAFLPVIYSLAWQIYHGKWCTLCLAIDFILIVDLLGEILLWGIAPRKWHFQMLTGGMGFGCMFALCLLAVKRIVEEAEKAERTLPLLKYRNERLLSIPDVFWKLLREQPPQPVGSKAVSAVSNFLEAEHSITLVMNPLCPKCVAVHRMVGLLEGYRIRLVFWGDEADRKSCDVAKMLIAVGLEFGWDAVNRAIAAWYERQEFPEGMPQCCDTEEILEAQLEYCRKIRVEGTPTVLVDDRRIPEIYDAADLKILL